MIIARRFIAVALAGAAASVSAARAQDAAPPSPAAVLLDLALATEGRLHGVLRDEFLALGAPADEELRRRAAEPSHPVEAWLAEALSLRRQDLDDVPALRRAWRRGVNAISGDWAGSYDAMTGRTRVDLSALPESPLWPSLLADWAVAGWDGLDPVQSNYSNGRPCMELTRFHALLALAAQGEVRVVPILEQCAADKGLRKEQRVTLAAALAELAPRGGDAALREAPTPTDPSVVPHLLRRAATEGTGRAIDGWATAAALERIQSQHPHAFAKHLAAEAEAVLAFDGSGAGLRHAAGRANGALWTAEPGRDAPGHIVLGPYTNDLAAGRYVVRFRLRCRGFDESSHQLELDVAHHDGREIAASRSVGGWGLSENRWKDVFVGFASPGGEARTEFRVRWDGKCQADVGSITVFRVRPAVADDTEQWTPPVVGARPLGERVAAATHLLRRAAGAQDREYVALRAGLDLLPEGARIACEGVPPESAEGTTAALLLRRAADVGTWDALTTRFGSSLRSASLDGNFGHILGAQLEWQIAIDVDRTVAIKGEAPAPAPAPGDQRAAGQLPASELWPGVLMELARHGCARGIDGGAFADSRPPPPRDGGLIEQDAAAGARQAAFDAQVLAAHRFHAVLHAARLGEAAAREVLRDAATSDDTPAGQRAAALGALAVLEPEHADALLEANAGPGSVTALTGRLARWLGEYGVVAARPYLWRRVASGVIAGAWRWPVRWAGDGIGGALGTIQHARPAASAELDAAALTRVAVSDLPEAVAHDQRLWVDVPWRGGSPPRSGPHAIRLTAATDRPHLDPAIWRIGGAVIAGETRMEMDLVDLDPATGSFTLVGALPLDRKGPLSFQISILERDWGNQRAPRPLAVVERIEILRVR